MKVALVYDRINKWGGAERILKVLHEIWPDAPLYTGVYNQDTAKWASDFDVRPTFVQRFPFSKSKHEWYPWVLTLGFESLSFDNYDVVISIASAEAKGIITKPNILHICYCLTPTRYLWTHKDIYLQSIPKPLKPLGAAVIAYLQKWDKIASSRPDYYVAICKTVQKRIREYYKRKSEVIYPPVSLCSLGKSKLPISNQQLHNCFLVVSRLVPYKRIELAIEACNKLKLPLVIVGDGTKKRKLQNIAGDTIIFRSDLTDSELIRYYQFCRALIVPQDEDFGLVSLEAQACGTPVIAFGRGGSLETVVEGKTGEFFEKQTASSLARVLSNFDSAKYNRKDCINHARKFSKQIFKSRFRKFVENKYKEFKND